MLQNLEYLNMDLSKAKAETLGHLGLIAATLQDLNVMQKVDEQFGQVEDGLNYGYRVGAMVLNGLGFINTALYMTPRFFHDKPLSLLLGEGVSAEQLNDDSLGRCLDKIAKYGVTKWYSELALDVVTKAGLLSRMAHLDSTTLSLYGKYDELDDGISPKPLLGYSKDHRPDLKQVTLQCVSLGKSALPIWMEALDGNISDKKSFPETVKRVDSFYKELSNAPKMCFVADSALYGEGLDELNVDWLTRVPEIYSEAKLLCDKADISWDVSSDPRYKTFEYSPEKKDERWLLVRSEPAFNREKETLLRKHGKMFVELEKSLWHCSCQIFNCETDAKKAVEKVIRAKKHFYDVFYEIEERPYFANKGRPQKNKMADGFTYHVTITGIASRLVDINNKKETLGRFILATNVLDKKIMTNEAVLLEYKEQSEIERGFRFIKNDTFGLDEVYLKKPERIGALMAIMTLCLLVYGLTQYRLREALKKHDEALPNQKKKPTQSPTLMWVFSLFSSIIMINIPMQQNEKNQRVVMNLHPLHQKVILLLGENAKKIYLLPENLKLSDIELNQKNWLQWCGM
jgi:transposase